MLKVELTVYGKVQRVAFRWGVQQVAYEIGGIYGRAWNNEDGSVGIHAQSEDAIAMKTFISRIKAGPTDMAVVDRMDIKSGNFKDYTRFIAEMG